MQLSKFLNEVIYDNTVKAYLVTAVVIVVVFLFKRYIAHYVASFVYFLLKKRYPGLNRAAFVSQVPKPLGMFIAVLIMVTALDKLSFPHQLDVSIYRLKLQELLNIIGTAAIIFTFFNFLIRCIDFVVELINERYVLRHSKGNHQLLFFFKDFIKVIVGIIGVLILLKYAFNYDIKGLVTGLSIVGAAVALALKESLENLIASFIIFFDKPFETGDSVKGGSYSGTVEKIGLRSTRIRTDAKTYVTVPNKQMVDSVVDNLSNRTQRRADLRLEISVDTEPAKVEALLDGIRKILGDPEVQNFGLSLSDIMPGALVINADYYTTPDNIAAFTRLKEKVNFSVLTLMENIGVTMAGKSTSVSIVGDLPSTQTKATTAD